MMRMLRHRRRGDARGDAGFTLVELLVVTVLLGIVGSITVAGLVRAFDSSRQTSARTHAIHELELSLQQVGRELRAADPLFITADGDYPRRVAAEVVRDRQVRIVRYQVAESDDENEFQLMQETTWYDLDDYADEDVETDPLESDSVLVTRLDNADGDVFGYYRSDGTVIDCDSDSSACQQAHANAAQIRIRFERTLDDGDPIRAETRVNVRSTRYGG